MADLILTDAAKRASQEAFAVATRTGDLEAFSSLYEPDAVVWHNHDDVAVDVEQSNRSLRRLHRVMPDVAWEDVSVLLTPIGFVWQALLTGTAPGGPVRAHTCMVVTLSESGLVERVEEYLDTASLRPLLG